MNDNEAPGEIRTGFMASQQDMSFVALKPTSRNRVVGHRHCVVRGSLSSNIIGKSV